MHTPTPHNHTWLQVHRTILCKYTFYVLVIISCHSLFFMYTIFYWILSFCVSLNFLLTSYCYVNLFFLCFCMVIYVCLCFYFIFLFINPCSTASKKFDWINFKSKKQHTKVSISWDHSLWNKKFLKKCSTTHGLAF